MRKLFFSCFILIKLALLFIPTGLKSNIYLKETDIVEIYEKYVKPNSTGEYANRYVPLPLEKNIRNWKWEGKDFPRVIALLEFEKFVNEHNLASNKGLALNGIDPEWEILPHQEITSINYVDNPKLYDLHIMDLLDKDFDFVMVNQTLEHVYDPIRCLKNVYTHMRKGGILYFGVPANNIPHETPFHFYTGITPTGAGAIVRAAGFKILSIGQWGNFEYLRKIFTTHSWPDYRALKNRVNDSKCPVITWVFARKE